MRHEERNMRDLAAHLLHTGLEGLGEREHHALIRISKRLQATRTEGSFQDDELSFGERLADRVAEFGGSWAFISLFGAFLLGWAVLNTDILRSHAFDPYPYVFLNLILSMLAAIQAPITALYGRLEHITWQRLEDMADIKSQLGKADSASGNIGQ